MASTTKLGLRREQAGGRPSRILIVDDQRDVLEALRLLLKPEGYEIAMASSPQSALDAVRAHPFDAVVIDLNYARDTTSGQEGLQLLADLHALAPGLPVLAMTAWGSISLAVEAMRRGAVDFVTKPWESAHVLATLRRCIADRDAADPSRASAVGGRELSVARAVQERLLPRAAPNLSTLACAAACEESGPVGGDFYDFIDLGAGLLALVVADVSGKGVPAALVMAHLSATLRSLAPSMRDDLARAIRKVNRLMLETTGSQHYVTVFLGIYHEASRSLRYVNCGHPPPLLRHADGTTDWLAPTGPVIGLLETFDPREQQVHLQPGATLIVYSDGLTETVGRDGDELGAERLASFLGAHAWREPEPLLVALLAERRAFAGGPERDDVTVLVAQSR